MSQVTLERDYFVQIAQTSLARAVVKLNGADLSERDAATCRETCMLHVTLLNDILSVMGIPFVQRKRTVTGYAKSLSYVDIFLWEDDLSYWDSQILRNCLNGNVHGSGAYVRYVGEVLRVSGACGLNHTSVRALLHQWFTFPKRLSLENESLERSAREKYDQNIVRVAGHTTFTCEERAIISKWLAAWQPPSLEECGFGNGVTCFTRRALCDKFVAPMAARTRYVLRRWFPDRDWDHLYPNGPEQLVFPTPPVSQRSFVPKSYKTFRTVASCDPWTMFAGRGLSTSMQKAWKKTDLRWHVDLSDQWSSRLITRMASRNQQYATVDFSMASDSVNYNLVQDWFADTPCYGDLRALREPIVAISDDESFICPWYASMGNILCFPVESMVFAAMVVAALQDAGVNPAHSAWRVYGDDVIIDERAYEAFVQRAEYNGFLVNAEKSFHGNSDFRESCGMEAIDGVDITPIRLSRWFTSEDTVDRHLSLVALANKSYLAGYQTMRLLAIRLCRRPVFSSDVNIILNEAASTHPCPRAWDLIEDSETELGQQAIYTPADSSSSRRKYSRIINCDWRPQGYVYDKPYVLSGRHYCVEYEERGNIGTLQALLQKPEDSHWWDANPPVCARQTGEPRIRLRNA